MAETTTGIWLRTNELEEFVGALEFTASILPSTVDDPARWKWTIIALHNALQGVCVCALRGADTSGVSVLDKASGAAMWQWLNVESRNPQHPPPPEEKLANTLELYKRAKKTQYLDNPLPPNPGRDKNIHRLNSLRNEFIHFVPKGFSVELSGMPDIVGSACGCIEHLAVDFPTFEHHFKDDHRQRISHAVSALKAFTQKI